MPTLTFNASLGDVDDLRNNLSAIVLQGPHLWLGGDEGTLLDRLTKDAAGNYGAHKRFELSTLLNLADKGPKRAEMDIEGLDFDGGYIWVTGSHCRKRKRPKGESPAKDIERLSAVPESELNRCTLGRAPLIANGPDFEPAQKSADGALTAARLEATPEGDLLTTALAKDPAIGAFVSIPSKDNGLDIEGLAVSGNRIFLGMRGPVLRGFAVIVEIAVADSGPGALKLTPLGSAPYRRHFLDLAGLGVRDLVIQGKDILILAGPTMVLDGPVFIFRWQKALEQTAESFIAAKQLGPPVLTVPFGSGKDAGRDHAEGFALIENAAGPTRALVVYDSPSETRAKKNTVTAEADLLVFAA
jgi:hypothetical protein